MEGKMERDGEVRLADVQVTEFSDNGWPASRVRDSFISFFTEKHDHTFWKSSPVVPHDDPTLLFANAGMNQFKPLFLGTADPALPLSKLTKATNSQKCIRAGGKHNDLDDVGKDLYHHTFFEMLGNWSFGSYFKEEAIKYAWDCLTETFSLDPSRLYATYFGGDEKLGVGPDEEAKRIWLKYLPESRVLPFSMADNFWEMGDVGPCGPCTEIHYDRIGGRDAAKDVNMDKPEVIEIWNVVFIQYNRESDGSLKDLPNKHVDTGLGFERLASILQGKMSNYDTDVFVPIFEAIRSATGARPYTGKIGEADSDNVDMAYRVVADHIRTLTMAITDGCNPSNDGRGYVLRRILRRAIRYGQQVLGGKPGFFHTLVPVVVGLMKDIFPELVDSETRVAAVLKDEETAFNKTLDKGLKEFNKVASGLGDTKVFPGSVAFQLYSSMGFPLDLLTLMAEEKGLSVDVDGFNQKMADEKIKSTQARNNQKATGGKAMVLEAEQMDWLSKRQTKATEAAGRYTWHQQPTAKASAAHRKCCETVLALFAGKGEGEDGVGFVPLASSAADESDSHMIGVVLDSTSFYAEGGGQIYDIGELTTSDGSGSFTVSQVTGFGAYILHIGQVKAGTLSVGSQVVCKVDYERRANVAPNHTMTHVLNFALRKVITTESTARLCAFCGSFVDDEKLRFDFSWSGALSVEQVAEVEDVVNDKIKKSLPVYASVAPLEQASTEFGLRSVFGERYPDPVRVLSVGQDVPTMLEDPENSEWSDVSVEFCGGTHLSNTQDAEAFVILEEAGIAKGVRRIVGVTRVLAHAAIERAKVFEQQLDAADGIEDISLDAAVRRLGAELDTSIFSVTSKNKLRARLVTLVQKAKALKKKMVEERVGQAVASGKAEAEKTLQGGGSQLVFRADFGCDAKSAAKILAEIFKACPELTSLMLFTADEEADRYLCCGLIPNSQAAKKDTNKWVQAALDASGKGGKGGGKGDRAQGISQGVGTIDKAMDVARDLVI
ncbi:unnamed protein product [Scytosiphon promiscuus]